ncbi:MAG TPA: 50S ribosomal protein L30 [Bellilinea sp.]|nr:50S ribosomal protein L30 [Bellilinea sp.]
MPKKAAEAKKLTITLVKSPIGYSEQHRATVRALGLRKIGQSVEHPDSPVVQGMIRKVNHLVKVEVQGAE